MPIPTTALLLILMLIPITAPLHYSITPLSYA
jgi:hypothetical protein